MLKLAIAAIVATALGGTAQAAITIHTTEASFTSATTASGTDTFDDLPAGNALSSSLNRTAGAYGYTVTDTATVLYGAGGSGDAWISNDSNLATLVFSGFTPGVSAAGGYFFGSDVSGLFRAAPLGITVTATDAGGTVSHTLISPTTSTFLGFVSTSALTQLTVRATVPNNSYWSTVNNLTLAQTAAVPEPTTWAMMICGLGLVGATMRRRSTRTVVAFG